LIFGRLAPGQAAEVEAPRAMGVRAGCKAFIAIQLYLGLPERFLDPLIL
jgi:hypothetical protein